MTIFELFPWLLAICVAALTGTLLRRGGLSGAWVWVIAVAVGIALFAAYWLALRWLASRTACQKMRREKSERERREYLDFDPAKTPVGRNLFYECRVCGNAIPSTPKKVVCCKCRNIMIDADSGRVEIRDPAKVKMFSLPPP
jgi:hypothetical protein